jgi:steroid delta-isomerase-like uncharacterized protein
MAAANAAAEENEILIRRWFSEVWNQRRPETIDELLAPDVIAHGMGPNGTDLRGPEGFRNAYDLFSAAFPDLHISIDQVVASADMAAAYFTCRGTHQGDHLGVPATGRFVAFPGMTMARYRDGRIIEGWNLIDFFSLFQQIGAAAPPGNVAATLP